MMKTSWLRSSNIKFDKQILDDVKSPFPILGLGKEEIKDGSEKCAPVGAYTSYKVALHIVPTPKRKKGVDCNV